MTNILGRTCVSTVLRSAKMALPILLILLAISSVSLFAQERFGAIEGTVMDASGAVMPNASVTITNKETNRVFSTRSSSDGLFTARNLDPGRYSVRIESTGFTPYEAPDVILLVGKTLRMDAQLQVGVTGQTVQVTEASPLIDVTGVAVSHNVTAEEFDRLPKARSFQSLALASPSVNSGEIEGGFQINGASGSENQFNIDGVSTTSLINGRSRQNAVFEILQEVQVKTAGIDAEYGGALGGVISAITRSGGNEFHGDVHYYLSGNKLSAGPTQRLLLDPRTERTASYVQDVKPKDDSHEIGYALGGYFIKNKLFFFSSMIPRFRNTEIPFVFSDGQRSTFSRDQTYHMMFNKVSFEPTSRLRTNFTWLWTPTKSTGRFPSLNDVGNTVASSLSANEINRGIGFFNPQSSFTGQVDFTVTPNSLLTVRGGRFWDDYKTTGIPGISSVEFATSAANLPFDIPANLRQATGYFNTPRLINTFHDLATRTYVQADYSLFKQFLGQHNLKVGIGTSKTVNNVDESYPGGGFIRVFWNSAFPSPTLGAGQRGTYGYYEANDRGTRGTTGAHISNMYIQDQWRILPRLTLTLGLRTENEKVPSFRRDIRDTAFQFGYADKLAPRLGASYDVFGNGKVKVFGSWGRYYDWVKYELSRGTFGGDVWKIKYRSLDTTDVFSLSGTNVPGRNIWSATSESRDRRVPSFDLIGHDIKPMGTELTNAGVEIQLAHNAVFRGSYVRNNLRRTIEDLGALDANGDEVYLYANPGEGDAKINPSSGLTKPFPMPKPKRTYDAMELSLTKRFSDGYFASASYVLSRLYGNYAGIASSDEITSPSTGLVSTGAQGTSAAARQGGSSNRAWDLDEILFDSHGHLDVVGRLATDRPHVFKLYGAKDFKFGTEVGVFFYGGSGTPLSTYVATVNQIPAFVEGRGDMGRTPFFTQTDLLIAHTVKLGEMRRLKFEANVLNLFNQKTARNRFNYLNRGAGSAEPGSAINLSKVDLFKGYDYRALIAQSADQMGTRGAYDPRYGMADIFNAGFAGRLGVKFIF
jgi:hypothetical protein